MPAVDEGNWAAGCVWSEAHGVVFGDSITWQDGQAYGESHTESGQIAIGWPTYLREALGCTVDNRALSGRSMVELWPEVIQGYDFTSQDFVWFTAGTNDYREDVTGDEPGTVAPIGSAYSTDTFAGALQASIEKALADNPSIKIFLATPIPGWFFEGGTGNVPNPDADNTVLPQSFADVMKAIGALYGIPVLDWYDRTGLTEANDEMLLGDDPFGPYLLHPTDEFYGVMGSLAVAEMLASVGENAETHGAPGDAITFAADSNRMSGGAGDDIYLVDSTTDGVRESELEGHDTVLSFVNFSLSENVEDLTLLGDASEYGSGNALDNKIVGNSSANTLKGGAGADHIYGGSGNDFLNGDAGNDIVDGGAGADTMNGGDGDDVYWVDNLADIVRESSATGGIDRVESSVKFSLGKHTENLTLIGGAPVAASGNDLDNIVVGNGGDNSLKGGLGADTLYGGVGDDALDGGLGLDRMYGGLGNDVYTIENAGDVAREAAEEGADTVVSSVGYALSANFENLTLTGTENINGSGNDLANIITGNAGANMLKAGSGDDRLYGGRGNDALDGGVGADLMHGGLGDDVYVTDNAGDLTEEAAGEGTDTVVASVGYSLSANVENLTLAGGASINGSGNDLNNVITGNGAANVLKGGAGQDTIKGGAGDDTLNGGLHVDTMNGGLGDDAYYVGADAGDVLNEDDAAGGVDTVVSERSWSLGANFENLTLVGSSAADGGGNDLNNIMIGNSATNALKGGAGKDSLFGGLGADTLSGGSGQDKFYFDTALGGANVDRITDFSAADDTFYLDQSIFAALATGTLANDAFRHGTAAFDADDRIIYDSATGQIWYDADGNGAGAAVHFANVTPGSTVTNADFFMVM